VAPWLSSILQSEHLALLLGSGFTSAIADVAGVAAATMASAPLAGPHSKEVESAAANSAAAIGRGDPNVEDRIRAALTLIGGLDVLGSSDADEWRTELDRTLRALVESVLASERDLAAAITSGDSKGIAARSRLISFLLTFASRAISRERLQLFTTNYDRLVEFGCDEAGLRPLDRFVGGLEPIFRASRLETDLHYNPPGIRGEPRYLEGVLRLTKVHGSLDWQWRDRQLRRVGVPFGSANDHPGLAGSLADRLIVYPNPAKDVETALYPYAELFRDLSAALCRPNSVLVTYGYGFGDDHINRVLRDMLTIPSTHIVAISYDWCSGRLERFTDSVGRSSPVSLIVGPQLANLPFLVDHLLPKPAIEVPHTSGP
jgi:hypothetical protein